MYSAACPNAKLHALADHVPSMLASWDSDLRCRFANRAYKNWFGVESSGMLGTSIRDLLGPKLFELNEPYMRRALAGEGQVFERLIQCPDGVGRHSLARYTPEVADGEVVGFFVEVTDVTRMKTTELELQYQIERLETIQNEHIASARGNSVQKHRRIIETVQQAARAEYEADAARRDEFLAQLAHELRNSLAPIKAGALVLGQVGARPAALAEKVGSMMSRQVSHLARLVDDLSDLAGIKAGILSISMKRTDLRDVIREALVISTPMLEEVDHTLTVDGMQEALPVDADSTRLVQVFSNLLNNAAKYTPRGGQISVTASVEGPSVRVAVQDTGVGMPPDASNSVFGMFSQLDESADLRRGGVGIGLALVRQIVEAHGGSVTASSPGRGMGSTFTVYLPMASDRRDRQGSAS